jgi:glycosyltransferase involved in cell wall biosynthesis
MTSLLYIGNYLNSKRSNVSNIHVLGGLLEAEGYVVHYSSKQENKVLRLLDMLYSCFKYRKRVGMVLIDTYSTQNFYYAVLCSQLCRLLKLPYICNLNGGNLPYRLKTFPKLSRMIFAHAVHNVAPSLYLKNAFEFHGYPNVVHIPNTIELDKYPLSSQPFDQPKLLWVRSFAKLYNPELAVRVLHALNQKGYQAELCMVGPDSDGSLAEVKQLAQALKLSVRFTGKLSKTEWISLSKAYNVFINTTNFDNTPVSVIEAMALGLPVVSTNVGGMPFLIKNKEQGLLVPPNTVPAMVDAILQLFEFPEQRQVMIVNARQLTEQFDWQAVKPLWAAVLNQKHDTD